MLYYVRIVTSDEAEVSMYQFIVNPSSGAGRGYLIWKRLERQLEKEGQEYRVYFTERQGDAADIARNLTADKEEAKILVVVGGEGTYNEVLNGASFKGMLTMGYVPVGFRNALSRGFQSVWDVKRQIKLILHPKYYRMLDYGVVTCGDDEDIFSRRFAARCGIGLDAAICHNILCCPARRRMCHFHMTKLLYFFLGLKQLILAKPVKGYMILDGVKKVEFNHLYFISFSIRRELGKRKKTEDNSDSDGRLTVFLANSSKKRKMIPILLDVIVGIKKKERGVRIFECREASIHLGRPLAVHVDGESCLCQQDLQIRCINKKIRMIGSTGN